MSRVRRKGLAWEPPDGWPLDRILVGVATVRTIRQLIREEQEPHGRVPNRPWDLALWSGVTPQGTANSLKRLEREGLARSYPAPPGHARPYRFDRRHPLASEFRWLFEEERLVARRT